MMRKHTNCKEHIYRAHTRLLSKLKENVVYKKKRAFYFKYIEQ